jgi:hypothetical protein
MSAITSNPPPTDQKGDLEEENKGMFSGVMKTLDSILECPDNPSLHWTLQKVIRFAFEFFMVGAGFAIFIFMTGSSLTSINLHTLADPGIQALMAMPISIIIAGAGLAWFIEDLMGPKYRRIASKIMGLLFPLFMAAGGSCLIAAGMHGGPATPTALLPYFTAGVILIPCALIATGEMLRRFNIRESQRFIGRETAFEKQQRVQEEKKKRLEDQKRRLSELADPSRSNDSFNRTTIGDRDL